MTSFAGVNRRRAFGRVRRLPSGRYQARFLTPGGQERRAPCTFETEREAELFLATVEADLRRGTWFDATAGDIRLDVYAPRWIAERPVELQPRTLEIYESLLRNHIYPEFGRLHLSRITSAAVRSWHASLRERGVGQVTAAKAYRLLKAICATAVEDELIAKNPCRLRNAGVERSRERKPPSLEEVERIADAIEPRYRAMVVLAAWSGLRWGELAALSRKRIDRLHGSVHVEEAMIQLSGGRDPAAYLVGHRRAPRDLRRTERGCAGVHESIGRLARPRELPRRLASCNASGGSCRIPLSRLAPPRSNAGRGQRCNDP